MCTSVCSNFFPASKTSLTYKLLSVTEHCWRRVNHLKTLLLLTTSSVKTQKLSKLAKLWSWINEWALTSTILLKEAWKDLEPPACGSYYSWNCYCATGKWGDLFFSKYIVKEPAHCLKITQNTSFEFFNFVLLQKKIKN